MIQDQFNHLMLDKHGLIFSHPKNSCIADTKEVFFLTIALLDMFNRALFKLPWPDSQKKKMWASKKEIYESDYQKPK